MKVFLSQVFHGKTEDEVMEERNRIWTYLSHDYYSPLYMQPVLVLDNYHINPPSSKKRRKEYFKSLMSKADLIVFVSNWEEREGCRLEMEIARENGMDIMVLSGNERLNN